MKYLPHDGTIYNTNFTDDILSVEWRESELENDDLKNYKFRRSSMCASIRTSPPSPNCASMYR